MFFLLLFPRTITRLGLDFLDVVDNFLAFSDSKESFVISIVIVITNFSSLRFIRKNRFVPNSLPYKANA